VDLPTYTNIWRIEKRLYKLYDFRLPAPLPISWIAVFAGITAPYIFVLAVIGVPFNHNLVWLYVVPPGVLTWLTTRPVLENKRLPELLVSQLRYLSEPRTWCRMAALTEKDEIRIYVRVWHRAPARSEQAAAVPALAGRATGEPGLAPGLPAGPGLRGGAEPARKRESGRQPGPGRTERPPLTPQPVQSGPATWPHAGMATAQAVSPNASSPAAVATEPAARQAVAAHAVAPSTAGRRAAGPPAAARTGDSPAAQPAAAQGSGAAPAGAAAVQPEAAAAQAPARSLPASPPGRSAPIEVSHEEGGRAGVPLWIVPAGPRIPAAGGRPGPAAGGERKPAPPDTVPSHPVPSIERALSGPAKDRIDGWQRRVKVVPGGQGPGKRDQEALDRDRARLPLPGPRRMVFLGCTSGAGQTVTALMTGQMLAGLRGVPIAAIDLNPGERSLSGQARATPVLTVAALLAGSPPPDAVKTSTRLDIIASDADPVSSVPGERDYARLAELTARHYPLAVVDPGASEVTRVLGIADQLVLVAPASGDASRSLAMTQEWLGEHGHGDLAARAVTVINGVSRSSMTDVEQAEAVARGRCRAIVRIPWDDVLAAAPAGTSSLRPQTRHAYTALAGVLVAGLAAVPVPRKVLH
jgi:MinD-like ATPase involved in chromosome partitioning or flagellar assembly